MHILLCANAAFPKYFWKTDFNIWELKIYWLLTVLSRQGKCTCPYILQMPSYAPKPKHTSQINNTPKPITGNYLREEKKWLQKQYFWVWYLQLEGLWRHSSEIAHFLFHKDKWREKAFCNAVEKLIYSVTFLYEKSWLQLQQDVSTYIFLLFYKDKCKRAGYNIHSIKI